MYRACCFAVRRQRCTLRRTVAGHICFYPTTRCIPLGFLDIAMIVIFPAIFTRIPSPTWGINSSRINWKRIFFATSIDIASFIEWVTHINLDVPLIRSAFCVYTKFTWRACRVLEITKIFISIAVRFGRPRCHLLQDRSHSRSHLSSSFVSFLFFFELGTEFSRVSSVQCFGETKYLWCPYPECRGSLF